MFSTRNNGNGLIVTFFIGGMLGASLALLFAPHSGKKMRKRISDMADDARDYATEYAKKLR